MHHLVISRDSGGGCEWVGGGRGVLEIFVPSSQSHRERKTALKIQSSLKKICRAEGSVI